LYLRVRLGQKLLWIIANLDSPISTYGGRGCRKPGLAKWQHCIIYTGKDEPGPLSIEIPVKGELPMLSSIQVRPKYQRDKLFPETRINFGKMYTVEHNVKVYDFGDVRKSYISTLVKQWRWVFDTILQGNAPNMERVKEDNVNSEESGDDDNEGQDNPEDDSDVESEVALPANGTALWPWSANENEQLVFQAGDTILITEWADENWGRGKNVRTGKKGVFARNYVNINSAETDVRRPTKSQQPRNTVPTVSRSPMKSQSPSSLARKTRTVGSETAATATTNYDISEISNSGTIAMPGHGTSQNSQLTNSTWWSQQRRHIAEDGGEDNGRNSPRVTSADMATTHHPAHDLTTQIYTGTNPPTDSGYASLPLRKIFKEVTSQSNDVIHEVERDIPIKRLKWYTSSSQAN
jgi:hypothetical protein